MNDDQQMLLIDVGCAIALLIIAAIGSALPFLLYSGGGRSMAFQLGSMLSGGVMLSAGLCHLLAEAMKVLQDKMHFPLGPFLCASGFLATLVVDQIAEVYTSNQEASRTSKSDESLNESLFIDVSVADGKVQSNSSSRNETDRIPTYTVAVLAVSLLFHSVLEGLALGTEEDIDGTVDIFIAIGSHKGLAAYALGACVIESAFSKRASWVAMSTFCLASPVGVMAGYVISTFSDSMTSASLSSAAAGTFLYVALMEVIPKELARREHKIKKIIALIVGFLLMSSVAIWD